MNASSRGSVSQTVATCLLAAGMLTACGDEVAGPAEAGGLQLTVVAAQLGADQGRFHIEGPSNRTVTLSPGDREEIDLPPGSYTLALEALAAGTVVGYWERGGVVVTDGRQTPVTASPSPFTVGLPAAVSTVTLDEPFTVSWSGVGGAESYDLQVADSPSFDTILFDDNVSGTSVLLTVSEPGTFFFRVRPRTRFGGVGDFSAPSSGTRLLAAPVITGYDVVFAPVIAGCGVGNRDVRTDEVVFFADPDGDMDPGRQFREPLGGGPVNIESSYRLEGSADWSAYSYERVWMAEDGSEGTAGGLALENSTCWDLPDDITYLDYRVRVQDASGQWSEWFEQRLHMPATVEIVQGGPEPGTLFFLPAGASEQYVAEARDGSGALVPGDPINWSVYVGPDHATVTPGGLYSVAAPTIGGLDWVTARAGFVHVSDGIIGGDFDIGSWFSPGWTLSSINIAAGTGRSYPLQVYAGREYSINTSESDNTTVTGDVDLFVRFGQPATLTEWDDRSTNLGHQDEILFTASETGVLWILLYAWPDPDSPENVAGARFNVDGDLWGFPENEALAAPVLTGTPDAEGIDEWNTPLLLAPAPGSRPSSPTHPLVIGGEGR